MERFSVIVSGFDRYESVDVNPSREVPEALESQGLILGSKSETNSTSALDDDVSLDCEISIHSVMLPVSFTNAWPTLKSAIDKYHPDIVIATGLKHAARGIALERCATNLMDAARPDADNVKPRKIAIVEEGPAAYWTRLPLRSILEDFSAHSIPATLSSDAGTYVCNSLFYHLLNWTSHQRKVLSGFVSFPLVNEHGGNLYGLPLKQQIAAGRDVVKESLRYFREPANTDVAIV
ncbi:pyroglutamyl-peptidase I [Bifidobacterium aquikefiricola]|uniref:Pyroglutamyl-peptidase I n=1 Tax=Bifidobacterium aquikefiricola TaxID=3059038 RepID=A0AB39U982_9BIFI